MFERWPVSGGGARSSIGRELQEAISQAELAASAGARADFAATAAAIETLEVHVLDRLRYREERASLPVDLRALQARAEVLRKRLQSASERILGELRRQVRSGRHTPGSLRRALVDQAGPPASQGGYDTLDLLVAGLLGSGVPAPERVVREPEMIGYQPTPARKILTLIERAGIGPEDTLIDLGSGLGHVVILVAMLTGARVRGVEIEPAYCDHARRCARRLKVPRVEFIQADARVAPLAGGTVYFMYTPFRGELLRHVMRRLETEARDRAIRLCSFGPCTAELADVPWLAPADRSRSGEHEVAVFHGRPLVDVPLPAP